MNKILILIYLGLAKSLILLIALPLILGAILSGCSPNNTTSSEVQVPLQAPVAAQEESLAPTASPTAFSEFNQPTVTVSLTAPDVTPTKEPQRPPACRFDVNAAPAQASTPLDSYVFSEPEVVLTETSSIGIAEWLPDGQRILITRRIPHSDREYIETYNVQTEKLELYGERNSFNLGFEPKPIWLTSKQSVAFTDSNNGIIAFRVSQGTNALVQESLTNLTSPYLGVSPLAERFVFLMRTSSKQPQILNLDQSQSQPLPITLPLASTQKESYSSEPYKAIWHPIENYILFYNDTGTYLSDLITEELCEVNLESFGSEKLWAVEAKWSPDGRYLALLTTVGEPIVPFITLTLIDMNTGEQRDVNLGHQYLYSMTWAPNSHNLLVGAAIGQDEAGIDMYGLYLVNTESGKFKQILPHDQSVGTVFRGVAWSAVRQEIALACPIIDSTSAIIVKGRLCIISVEVKQ